MKKRKSPVWWEDDKIMLRLVPILAVLGVITLVHLIFVIFGPLLAMGVFAVGGLIFALFDMM